MYRGKIPNKLSSHEEYHLLIPLAASKKAVTGRSMTKILSRRLESLYR